MDMEPREAESMAVTLTRMEGKLDRVDEKVTDLKAEVGQHRVDIATLKADQQQIKSDLRGAEETRLATLAAVKEAEVERLAAANAQALTSAQRWTPWQRFFAVLGIFLTALTTAAAVTYYLSQLHH
jgi:peptidoglycan hydrolase CwlO-like protein